MAAAGRKPPAAGDPDAAVDRDAAVSDCRRLIQFDAKRLYKTASPGIGNGDGPILCATLDPAQFEAPRGQRCAKRSGQMGAPFAPVEARAAEDSTAPLRSRKINPEVIEKPRSAAGYLAALIAHYDMPTRHESIGQPDPEPSSKVVVARTRRPERFVHSG